jgi:hypothetical protein
VSVVLRLRALWAVIARYSSEPYLKGRAFQAGGAALVADGLVGLENPLGSSKRAGIFGSVLIMVMGAVFAGIGWYFVDQSRPYSDGETATAVVTSVVRNTSADSDGNQSTTCSLTAAYEVNGRRYSVSPGWSSDRACGRTEGDTVEVSYRVADPGAGRVLLGDGEPFGKIFMAVGVFIFLGGLFVFVVRAVSITAGVWMLLKGRALVRDNPGTGVVDDVLAEMSAAWESAAPRGPHLPGTGWMHRSATHTPTPPPNPAGPPAAPAAPPGVSATGGPAGSPVVTADAPAPGWFPDPLGGTRQRWWDGTRWTDTTSD